METRCLRVVVDELTGPVEPDEDSDGFRQPADQAEAEGLFGAIRPQVVEQLRVQRLRPIVGRDLRYQPMRRDEDTPPGQRPWHVEVDVEPLPDHPEHLRPDEELWVPVDAAPPAGARVRLMVLDPLCWHVPQGYEPFVVGRFERAGHIDDGSVPGGVYVQVEPDLSAQVGDRGRLAIMEALEHERDHVREDGSGCRDLFRFGPLGEQMILQVAAAEV
jgi:hypothetical protein